MDVMQVSSDIREAMVEFIARSKLEVSTTGTSSASIRGLANLGDDLVAGAGGLTGGSGSGENVVNENGEIVKAPPPPLTTEDVKMGSGSKTYQKINPAAAASKDVAAEKDADGGVESEKEKPVSGTTTALNVGPGAVTAAVGSRRDHIQVTVEDVDDTSGTGSAAVVPGLTRRTVGGSGGGPDAVVSSLVVADSLNKS